MTPFLTANSDAERESGAALTLCRASSRAAPSAWRSPHRLHRGVRGLWVHVRSHARACVCVSVVCCVGCVCMCARARMCVFGVVVVVVCECVQHTARVCVCVRLAQDAATLILLTPPILKVPGLAASCFALNPDSHFGSVVPNI